MNNIIWIVKEVVYMLKNYREDYFGCNDGDLDKYENKFLDMFENLLLKIRYFIWKY